MKAQWIRARNEIGRAPMLSESHSRLIVGSVDDGKGGLVFHFLVTCGMEVEGFIVSGKY